MEIQGHDCYLVDDGTLDTVISIDGEEFRFSQEYASIYREKDGALTEEGFNILCEECIDQIETFSGM